CARIEDYDYGRNFDVW
nr:immunoglobulin heavy chain junction region [Mus musculus]MBK4196193.1 immunoglobulin heavy chain junction region [Mus musculus]MBK4196194.1 immunoglobulin heavy chain junction region [Mus musculus]MBK4196195.1 immunoglobulin heavy chain junction region [Mus musculus]MBK4196196.1 immunoglobulin heavy chain junction region [Mus musculus]